jgi:signal transduction histidine kinase
MIWQEYFSSNRIIILAIYGQVFFVLGLAIFLQSRRHSRLKLARDLRWLALFGVLHGFYEWGWVFIPIQAEYVPPAIINLLRIGHVGLLAISFISLLIFGIVLLETTDRRYHWLGALLVMGWIFGSVFAFLISVETENWLRLSAIWARYLIGFPGALLAAIGLYQVAKTEIVVSTGQNFNQMLRWAGHSLVLYSVVAGLVTAPGSFFPANILNRITVENWLGIPIEIFRSVTGFFLAITIIRALELFEVEVDRLIEKMEVEAIQAAERDRIGQEIHDGAMQGVYSVSLILNSMTRHVDNPPAIQRLAQAQQVLERVTADLRRYMTSLRIRPPERSLTEELAQLVADPRFSSLIDIRMDIAVSPASDPERNGHLLGLVQEALSNIVRHAGADQVVIRLFCEGEYFVLEVRDNGQGFDSEQTTSGYGLQTMNRHARLIGATMTLDTWPGKGTTVRVKGLDRCTT